jgi:lipopolysaccharide export system permease protein
MRKTLAKYLLIEQSMPLCVCFFGLSLILVTGRLVQLTAYLFTSSLTFLDLLQVMAFAIPKLILFALPMATLTGILLAFLRLNNDNEIIALRAAGVSFIQFLPAVLLVASLAALFSFYNTLLIIPNANKAFEEKLSSLGRASLPALLKEGTFIDIIPDLVFFFKRVDTSNLSVEGIFVHDQRQQEVRVTIVAEHARIAFQKDTNNLTFNIANGVMTRVPESLRDAQTVAFRDYELKLSLDDLLGYKEKDLKSKRVMTLSELYRLLYRERKSVDAGYAQEFHQRLALPFSCLMLGLIGAPLGSLFRQRNRMSGITLGLVVYLAYYVVLSAGKAFSENGFMPVSLAIWLPNLFAGALATYLWTKIHRESPLGIEIAWKRLHALLEKLPVSKFRIRREDHP